MKRRRYLAAALALLLLLSGCHSEAEPTEVTTEPTETTGPTLPPNPYGPFDFSYENGYLTCISGESLSGVDVSAHQGEIRWNEVHDTGFQFAMIRIGYRGWGTGALCLDEWAEKNITGAKEAGMQVGCYFFSQATNPAEAVEEAEFVLSFLDGRAMELPIVFDWEVPDENARTAGMDGDGVTQCAKAFCERIRAAGYEPMIYFNFHFMEHYLDLFELQDYKFWFALYDAPMSCPIQVDMWQYTATGIVPGIDTAVDIDLLLTYEIY